VANEGLPTRRGGEIGEPLAQSRLADAGLTHQHQQGAATRARQHHQDAGN